MESKDEIAQIYSCNQENCAGSRENREKRSNKVGQITHRLIGN
jgi:hypothetical protein